MRDAGDISQEEYETLKTKLLEEQSEWTPPEDTAGQIESQTRWWLIGTGVLMAVGSLLPWARAGIFSAAGTEGDGILTLVGGVIVALVGVANKASAITGIGTAMVAGLSLLIVFNVFGNLDTDMIGSGLILTGLASLFAVIAGFKVFGEARS